MLLVDYYNVVTKYGPGDGQMQISRTSPVPLHHQLRELLEGQIREGVWTPEQMIPTESQLMAEYGVSRTTVRQALAVLVTEGLLNRQQGKGTFVAQPKIAESLESLVGFAEALQRRGLDPKITVLGIRREKATPQVQEELGLPAGSEVTLIERMVDVEGKPLFWGRSYLPLWIGVPRAEELREHTLFHWLETAGHGLQEAKQTMSARGATAEEAKVLSLKRGTPVLVIGRTIFGEGGRTVEYMQAIYRSDRFEYQIRLQRERRV